MFRGPRLVVAGLLFLSTFCASSGYVHQDGLYTAMVIVTGSDDLAERSRSIREARRSCSPRSAWMPA